MADLAMVMPMAGRGSRFARQGVAQPKPLVDLAGRPFFWWATESLRRMVPVREMVFVVLQEHVSAFRIDRRILEFYPDARIVPIPDVTSGAAETAMIGLGALATSGPVAINDSDHAFRCPELPDVADALRTQLDAALLCFTADSPAFSYARLDEEGRVVGTVEKRVVSPYAIAGCYLFSDPSLFLSLYEEYRLDCPYDELFVSGVYNRLAESGGRIGKIVASRHVSFGTPEELARVNQGSLGAEPAWLAP
ncbi:MAG: NTP transferase domain-containing protein [Gemmatimonadetes bacterium]|nr:NTP transferase domain-containing protein [Gemmatimonadota bacterium]